MFKEFLGPAEMLREDTADSQIKQRDHVSPESGPQPAF